MSDPNWHDEYHSKVVHIEAAQHIVLPEPSGTLMGASAIAVLFGLRRRNRS